MSPLKSSRDYASPAEERRTAIARTAEGSAHTRAPDMGAVSPEATSRDAAQHAHNPRWTRFISHSLRARFRERAVFRLVVANVGWLALDKVFRAVVGLATTVQVARYLGPQDFGELNFAIAFAALFSPLASMGIQHIVIRDLVRRPNDRKTILGSALLVRLAGGSVACVACIAVAAAIASAGADTRGLIVSQAIALLPLAWEVVDYDSQALLRPRAVIIVRCASILVFSIVRFAMVWLRMPLAAFGWMTFGELAFAGLLLHFTAKRYGTSFSVRDAALSEVRQLLALSWPLVLSGLSIMMYMRIDQVMLGQLAGKAEAGIFSAAVRISEAWYFLPMAIVAAVSPVLTAVHGTSPTDYGVKLVRTMRALSWTAVVVALLLSASASVLIRLLYGPAYGGSAAVLSVHAWAGVFVALGVAAGPWFINNGLQKFQLLQSMAGAAVNVGLNFVVIPRHGALGASFVTVASQLVSAVLVNALHGHTREVFLLQVQAILGSRSASLLGAFARTRRGAR